MTDFNRKLVTVAITPDEMAPLQRSAHRVKIMEQHREAADEITVLVPPGTSREAARMIWHALGTGPPRRDNLIDQFCDRLGLEP